MSDSDFFREVNEAVRQEQYRRLWDRYGLYVIGLAVLFVLSVAGYKFWQYRTQSLDNQAGTTFTRAVALSKRGDKKDIAKAKAMLEKLAKTGPHGYRMLSRIELAASLAGAGKTKAAVAAYDAIANDGHVDPIFRGDATIQAATLRLPKASYAEMERRLFGLIVHHSAWQYSAHELLGLSAYRHGDMDTAQKQFNVLMMSDGTPQNMRERANMMLSLIMGLPQKPGKTSGKASSTPKPTAGAGTASQSKAAPAAPSKGAKAAAPQAKTTAPAGSASKAAASGSAAAGKAAAAGETAETNKTAAPASAGAAADNTSADKASDGASADKASANKAPAGASSGEASATKTAPGDAGQSGATSSPAKSE